MRDSGDDERRGSPRHEVCFVVRLETEDGQARAGVIRDASDTGVFMLTGGTPLEVGQTVELQLVPAEDGEPTPRARGRVVRTRNWEASDLWRLGLGIQLEEVWSPSLALRSATKPS